MVTKKEIIDMLGEDSWNGVAVNGTPFTQWNSNKQFFDLFKEKKEEIKSLNFSLYKKDGKWLVTLFGDQIGTYKNKEEYLSELLEGYKINFLELVDESRDLSYIEREELDSEVRACNSISELSELASRELSDEAYEEVFC